MGFSPDAFSMPLPPRKTIRYGHGNGSLSPFHKGMAQGLQFLQVVKITSSGRLPEVMLLVSGKPEAVGVDGSGKQG
jgi:hypothetical protein